MNYRAIKYRKQNFLAIVSINCPPANAFKKELIEDLHAVFDYLSSDDSIRSVLITSLNKEIFLSGGDISSSADKIAKGDIYSQLDYVRNIQKVVEKVERIPKPTIASINGHALGGGFEFIVACDFRIMSDDNRIQLGMPEIDIGFIPALGGLHRVARKFGQHLALKMGLGFRLTAHEAFDMGLVDQLCPPKELFSQSIKFAKKLGELPTKAVALIKKIVIEGYDKKIGDVYRLELSCLEKVLATEDAREGINAFLEKRRPKFKGN